MKHENVKKVCFLQPEVRLFRNMYIYKSFPEIYSMRMAKDKYVQCVLILMFVANLDVSIFE